MANSLTPNFAEYWSRRMQRKHERTDVYRKIASFEEKAMLKNGDTVHRPYRSNVSVNTLGSEGSYTRQDISTTDESLVINQEKEVSFYLRDPDVIQSNYREANIWADDAAVKLSNQIDGQVFGEYDQAASSVDDGDLGGTAGNGLTLSTSNVMKVFTNASRKLSALNIEDNGRWGVVSPEFRQMLLEYLGGKESALGDTTGKNGHIGKFMGFDLYSSNSLGHSARLENGTIFADGDTITINGVVFNFKDTLGTVAGTIHICSDQEKTLNSLVAAINTPGTTVASDTDAGFVAVSAANQVLLKNIVATDGGTYMTLKTTGKSYIAVSEVITAAADIWTTTLQVQHNLFGQGNPIDLVIQKLPNLVIKDRSGYIGKDYVTWTLFGIKTFDEGDDQLVDVQIRSDAF